MCDVVFAVLIPIWISTEKKKKGNVPGSYYKFYLGLKILLFYVYFILTQRHFFLEREEGGERERDISATEKHRWVGSSIRLDWGLNLQSRYVPGLGIEPTTFQLRGNAPNNRAAQPGQTQNYFRVPSLSSASSSGDVFILQRTEPLKPLRENGQADKRARRQGRGQKAEGLQN